ncbi:hypothetical protein D3C73_1560520 [compost metagenome]
MRQIRSSGRQSMHTTSTHTPMLIGLDHRMPSSPLEIDSARRRFCSIRPPRMNPSKIGDSGKSSFRRM